MQTEVGMKLNEIAPNRGASIARGTRNLTKAAGKSLLRRTVGKNAVKIGSSFGGGIKNISKAAGKSFLTRLVGKKTMGFASSMKSIWQGDSGKKISPEALGRISSSNGLTDEQDEILDTILKYSRDNSEKLTLVSDALQSVTGMVSSILGRISARVLTVGKGEEKQSYHYDPLAPEGRKVTTLTAAGKQGRFVSKKEANSVLTKAAYSQKNEPKLEIPKVTKENGMVGAPGGATASREIEEKAAPDHTESDRDKRYEKHFTDIDKELHKIEENESKGGILGSIMLAVAGLLPTIKGIIPNIIKGVGNMVKGLFESAFSGLKKAFNAVKKFLGLGEEGATVAGEGAEALGIVGEGAEALGIAGEGVAAAGLLAEGAGATAGAVGGAGLAAVAAPVALAAMTGTAAYHGISDIQKGKRIENAKDIIPTGTINKLNPMEYAMRGGRYVGDKINTGFEKMTGGESIGSKVYDLTHHEYNPNEPRNNGAALNTNSATIKTSQVRPIIITQPAPKQVSSGPKRSQQQQPTRQTLVISLRNEEPTLSTYRASIFDHPIVHAGSYFL